MRPAVDPPRSSRTRGDIRTPLRSALSYAVMAAGWILLSDRLLARIPMSREALTRAETAKGWLFVLFTSALLYSLVRAAAAQIRRERGLAEAVLASVPDAVFVKDREGRYLFVNPAAERLIGLPFRAVRGKTSEEVYGPEAAAAIVARDAAVLQSGSIEISETEVPGPDGIAVRVRHGTTASLLGEDGRPIGLVTVTRDVTEERAAEAMLREREIAMQQRERLEALGRLAGGVAHDFNNLLTVITASADALASAGTPQAAEEAAEIGRAAARGARLTRQLLRFSRHRTTTDGLTAVDDAVTDVVALLTRTIPPTVQIAVHADGTAGIVAGDPSAVAQLVMTLALNAADAMPGGGALTVETTAAAITQTRPSDAPLPPGTYAVIRVSDSGGGSARLGLAPVEAIARQCGGGVAIERTPQGGSVTVYLRQTAAGTPTARARPRLASTRAPGELVLLVEDEGPVRAIARRALQRAGFEVLEARHGLDALALAEKETRRIALLVTDVMMPEMGGVALAGRLRGQQPSLPVLFMSGYTAGEVLGDPDDEAASRTAFLAKPFAIDELLTTARELIASSTHPEGHAA